MENGIPGPEKTGPGIFFDASDLMLTI